MTTKHTLETSDNTSVQRTHLVVDDRCEYKARNANAHVVGEILLFETDDMAESFAKECIADLDLKEWCLEVEDERRREMYSKLEKERKERKQWKEWKEWQASAAGKRERKMVDDYFNLEHDDPTHNSKVEKQEDEDEKFDRWCSSVQDFLAHCDLSGWPSDPNYDDIDISHLGSNPCEVDLEPWVEEGIACVPSWDEFGSFDEIASIKPIVDITKLTAADKAEYEAREQDSDGNLKFEIKTDADRAKYNRICDISYAMLYEKLKRIKLAASETLSQGGHTQPESQN